jgi:site-specific DNA recombinase
LRRVMELAEAGTINLVLVTKRDRFFRSRFYRLLWDRDLEELGVRLVALNDTGNRFGDAMQDEFAEWEREELARRTIAGRLQKAREGKIVASHTPHYGFRYNAARTNYVIYEEEMRIVRRIFELVGTQGVPMRAVKRELAATSIPAPKGGKYWHQTFIRRLIQDDAYKPHTLEELEELVSPEVAARLDKDRCYGVYWYGKCRKELTRDKRTRVSWNDRKDWIAVPVPDCGVPRGWVDAARGRIAAGRNRSPSTAGHRFWELSGMVRCAGCGRVMQNQPTKSGGNGKMFYYYRCSHAARNGREACPENRMRRAPGIESEVGSLVSELLQDPERLRANLERMIELEREEARGDPAKEARIWAEKLAEVERKRAGYLDLAATGRMTYAELDSKIEELEEAQKTTERELQALKERTERLKQLEKDKDILLE